MYLLLTFKKWEVYFGNYTLTSVRMWACNRIAKVLCFILAFNVQQTVTVGGIWVLLLRIWLFGGMRNASGCNQVTTTCLWFTQLFQSTNGALYGEAFVNKSERWPERAFISQTSPSLFSAKPDVERGDWHLFCTPHISNNWLRWQNIKKCCLSLISGVVCWVQTLRDALKPICSTAPLLSLWNVSQVGAFQKGKNKSSYKELRCLDLSPLGCTTRYSSSAACKLKAEVPPIPTAVCLCCHR